MDARKELPPAYSNNYSADYEQPINQHPVAANQFPAATNQYPAATNQYPAATNQYAANTTGGPYTYPQGQVPTQGQVSYSNYPSTVIINQPMPNTYVTSAVRDYMVLAVISIFCFWPIGIFALMKSNETRNHLARGDITAATISSNEAKRYSLIGIIVGVVAIVGVIIAVVVVVVTSAATISTSSYYYG